MHADRNTAPGPEDWAEDLVDWLEGHDEAEGRLRAALPEMASHRWDIASRMAEALKATAQGLSAEAAAAAAGLTERMLHDWLEKDPAFAHAVSAARSLAASRGLHAGHDPTPAMIHLVLRTIRQGAPWPYAAKLAGFSIRGFNRLRQEAPAVGALVEAAQRARPKARAGTARRARGSGPGPGSARGRSSAGYRLVHMDDPLLSPRLVGRPSPSSGHDREAERSFTSPRDTPGQDAEHDPP
ncbi:hypothetical protein ABZZ17_18170 [Streptomyces sp. NPDC006512]|uniref:hypothetical protein n=1 Tax=Streptomyces sp. NPDC006512 TaxID=3154307 RepID=UPI0033ACCEBD